MKRYPWNEVTSLLPYRARDLHELTKRVGDITPLIDSLLKRKKHVRVLEIGCGFGTILIQLKKRYGNRVQLTGINKKERHGNWSLMKKVAIHKKILTRKEADAMPAPTIIYCDVSKGLPFKKNTFDVIYSQVAFQYFDDKIKAIEEINRVLTTIGFARIHTMLSDPTFPQGYQNVLEIWNNGKEISLQRYLRKYPSVQFTKSSAGKRHLRMRKVARLNLGLRLVATVNINDLDKSAWGTKSIYTTH